MKQLSASTDMFMYESDKLGFRLLWILCVCGAITLFLVQVYDRAQTYFNYKTNTNVEVVYVSEVSFPSVTICNQNNYWLVYNHLHIKNNNNWSGGFPIQSENEIYYSLLLLNPHYVSVAGMILTPLAPYVEVLTS